MTPNIPRVSLLIQVIEDSNVSRPKILGYHLNVGSVLTCEGKSYFIVACFISHILAVMVACVSLHIQRCFLTNSSSVSMASPSKRFPAARKASNDSGWEANKPFMQV